MNNQFLITEFSLVRIFYQNDLFHKLKPRKGYINSEQQANWILAIVQTQWRGHEKANEYAYINQDFLLIFVLTGLRRSEIQQLALANIDLKYGTLKIINPKNGEDLLLPLGDTLLHIFKERKNIRMALNMSFQQRIIKPISKIAGMFAIKLRKPQEYPSPFMIEDGHLRLLQTVVVLGCE